MRPLVLFAALAAAGLVAATTYAAEPVLTGEAAFGDWKADAPSVRRLIRPSDLPKPFVTESASNFVEKVKMPDGAKPKVPEGFAVEMVASGIANPRAMRTAPNGDVFVADSKAHQVRVYRMRDGSAKPARESIFATGLYQPYGIAFYPLGPDPEWIYVANSHSVVRFPYRNGDLKARGKPERIIDNIPATHHWTRDIVFSPDGKTLFLAVGSGSNVALDMFKEADRRP